jgi:hypothetical protein
MNPRIPVDNIVEARWRPGSYHNLSEMVDMPRNDSMARGPFCPVIHIIDVVQPPEVGIPSIIDTGEHQRIVRDMPAEGS